MYKDVSECATMITKNYRGMVLQSPNQQNFPQQPPMLDMLHRPLAENIPIPKRISPSIDHHSLSTTSPDIRPMLIHVLPDHSPKSFMGHLRIATLCRPIRLNSSHVEAQAVLKRY